MAGRFSFSSPESRYGGPPWFRVGDVDITTTVLVAGACVLSMFVWAADPDLLSPLLLEPSEIRGGQIWRLATWPLANSPSIWTLITIAIFWYFGRELEGLLGRNRFATFLAILTILPAVVATVADFDLFQSGGISYVELGVFLTFIVEYPQVRFFFGIPGWVIGAVIIGIQILQLLGLREIDSVLFLVIIIATAAMTARAMGLATSLPWIPKLPLPGGAAGSSGSGNPPKRSGRRKKQGRRSSSTATVVDGPWQASSSAPSPDAAAAQAELDGLLDKISAGGLESLSSDEKRRLNELSKRLR